MLNSNPFNELAERYDAWFDGQKGRRIFRVELDCIRGLLEEMPHPWLEVGIGTGRFAHALGIDDGIDPSQEVLKIASQYKINTRIGHGEDLPYQESTYRTVLIIVTICFVSEPDKALREAGRVLRNDGHLILGLVPADSPWGKFYARKGNEGHPFYSTATFYTCGEVVKMAEKEGFGFERARSCLFESPETEVNAYSSSREGIVADSGFVGMSFKLGDPNRK